MSDPATITLMTDFGVRDSYVGCMKGVILSVDPAIRIVDVSHEVPAFNLLSAAYLLSTYYSLYPRGTVHMVVVDPEVGGPRAALAIAAGGWYFLLPDNGIATMALEEMGGSYTARRIENPSLIRSGASATFHGRDVFAPAAARLAAGFPFDAVGPAAMRICRLDAAVPAVGDRVVSGVAVHIDSFGNYISNITADHLKQFEDSALHVHIGSFTILGLSRTFSDKASGEIMAYIGSTGRIEIAVSKGSAAQTVGLAAGAEVIVRGRGGAK
jgi:S-adenosyl-L-methionine hydrolase (adenosine-forming)